MTSGAPYTPATGILGMTKLIDETGAIIDRRLLTKYEKICGDRSPVTGRTTQAARVVIMEAWQNIKPAHTFALRIEPENGDAFTHPAHFGTLLHVAKSTAEMTAWKRHERAHGTLRRIVLTWQGLDVTAYNGKDWD